MRIKGHHNSPQYPDWVTNRSHAKNVEAVFEAARGGQYRHGGGVDVFLRTYGLPGTVHDENGQSLLHYAASAKLADEGPLWLAPDIKSLVQNHNVYVNAVNYKGQTALHILAEKASMSDQDTCWNGKAVTVSQAWVELASLIMKLGCDPRIPDHSNLFPDEVARMNSNYPLAEDIEKERRRLGPINYSEKNIPFKDFLAASKLGQVSKIQKLLNEGVPVLPLRFQGDPIKEAILGGHRDAVFLLLSAGAPLCPLGLVGDTAFEAAHQTPGLPALFPAIIRMAVSGRLEFEMKIIRNLTEIPELVKTYLTNIKSQIENPGQDFGTELSKWLDQQPAESFKDFNYILASAASLGLTLMCQLMGMAGVKLSPLSHEKQPLYLALSNNHHYTAYALCRDLQMNPYAIGLTNCDISNQLSHDLLQSEVILFEKKLHKAELDENIVKNLLNYIGAVCKRDNVNKPSKMFLYLLSELGLVSLLYKTRRACSNISIDTIVHEASASTMLHIAAAYGNINMVEYLLVEGAEYSRQTLGGLTAAHLAAARGHRECMQYIIDYTGGAAKCSRGILPQKLLSDFDSNMKDYHRDLLSFADSKTISVAKDDYTTTNKILSSIYSDSKITSEMDLRDTIWKEMRHMREHLSRELMNHIQNDSTGFLEKVAIVDSRFTGKIISRNPLTEDIELFVPDAFKFYLELDNCHALNENSISSKTKFEKFGEFECITFSDSTKEQEFFSGSNFRYAFHKAAQETLKNFFFRFIALVPPFLTPTSTGISVHGIYRRGSRTHLVRLLLSPVLKALCPSEILICKRLQNQFQPSPYEHLANNESIWVYLFNMRYKSLLTLLCEDDLMVLWICLYFGKLLNLCWWHPRKKQKRFGCARQTYPPAVDFPNSDALISLFCKELFELNDEPYVKENVIERVIAILKRSLTFGERKVSFVMHSSVHCQSNSVVAVIHFLERISKENINCYNKDS
ncbi:hypothetical protein SK128_016929 [Halocaridina rubra]|uniref:Uncharacterized protein n=1 Tax=Halocaridina rubra TaxID=373956 RepID=A0AAN8WHV1_HALRR